jgi:hypothetical protein
VVSRLPAAPATRFLKDGRDVTKLTELQLLKAWEKAARDSSDVAAIDLENMRREVGRDQ